MNDLLIVKAIRKLPPRFVRPGLDLTRFGETVIAVHPEFCPLQFYKGKWRKINLTSAVRR